MGNVSNKQFLPTPPTRAVVVLCQDAVLPAGARHARQIPPLSPETRLPVMLASNNFVAHCINQNAQRSVGEEAAFLCKSDLFSFSEPVLNARPWPAPSHQSLPIHGKEGGSEPANEFSSPNGYFIIGAE